MKELQLDRRQIDMPAQELRSCGIPERRAVLPPQQTCPKCNFRHRALVCPICKQEAVWK